MRAGFVETFDNGSNNGDWHLTVNPATIEPDGGNPGPYLHATADAAVPTWYVPLGTAPTYFLGNFAGKKVGTLAFDINIFSGLEVPDRAVALDRRTYEFPVSAASPIIPPGWVVTKGNGGPETDSDWQALMQDVETIGVELGEPGFFYPFWVWDLGLDNAWVTRLLRQP
jgi:hypothetical protein